MEDALDNSLQVNVEKENKPQIGKEKVKTWLKDPYNILLIGILLFAFIVRVYYFSLTLDQPFWWDEAAYGSMAKNYITHIWDSSEVIIGETLIRPPLFPVIWSLLMRIGFEEAFNRFFLLLIPSILSVFFVYLIGKELYGKRNGLLSAFIFSVMWVHLFYTSRMLTHILSLAFLFGGIFFFIKSTKEEFNYKYFAISLGLAGIVALIRYPDGLVYLVFLLFLLLTKKVKLAKDSKAWLAALAGLIPLIIFFLYNYLTKGNIFPALLGSDYVQAVSKGFAWNLLGYIQSYYLGTLLSLTFLVGLIVSLLQLGLSFGFISKNNRLKGHLLHLLFLAVFFSFFIFYIKGAEDRWLFPLSLAFASFSALGVEYIADILNKYQKQAGVVLILAVLLVGAYSGLTLADKNIRNARDTFLQAKMGFEWIDQNTEKDSVIISSGLETYAIYYANRQNVGFPKNSSDLDTIDADYLVYHAYKPEAHPDFLSEYLQSNQDTWIPFQAIFADEEKKQAVFVIYKKQNKS
ncbi:MAG: glycosyltransferase family 39 protein [Nanoarchaeota archaeon]|nr:glycosyltransferase family 39 protein [Nanoarchaeota archaeon]